MSAQSNGFEKDSRNEFSIKDLELIINSSQDFIVSIRLDYTVKYANNAYKLMAQKAYGIEVAYNETSLFDLIPHYLHTHYKDLLIDVLSGETNKNETFRSYPSKNLPDAYFEEVFKPVYDETGKINSISLFAKDITQNYKIENQLAENEAILRGVFDSSSDEILSVNRRFEVTSFNKNQADTIEKLTGKKINLGTNIVRFLSSNGLENLSSIFKRRYEKGLSGEKFTETDSYEINGVTLYKELLINPILIDDSVIGVSIFSRDITQKIHNDRKTQENEDFLKSVQNMAQIGTWRHNLKTGEFSCSNYCFEIFGIIPTVKPTKELFEGMLGEENVQKIQASINDYLKNGKRASFEIKLMFSAHLVKYLTCITNPIINPNGEISEIIYVLQDISSTKKIQKELDNTNEFLSTILSASEYAIITTDRNGLTTSFNRAAENILGYSANDVIGKSDPVFWHDKLEIEALAKQLSSELGTEIQPNMEVFMAKSKRGLKNEMETFYITKSGERIPVSLSISAIYDRNKVLTGFVGIAKDISERRNFEAQLKQQNNLLNAIINSFPFDFWARDVNQNMVMQNAKSIEYWGDHRKIHFEDQNVPNQIISHWRANNSRAYAGEMVRSETKFDIRGKEIYIDEIISPIFDENKNVTGILGVNIDINDRKYAEFKLQIALEEELKLNRELANREEELTTKEEELRQSIDELSSVNDFIAARERQINTIFDNSPDIIVSIDKKLRVTAANKPFREIYFKIHKKEFEIGVKLKDFFVNTNLWEKYEPVYKLVLTGEIITQITDNEEELFGRYVSEEYYTPLRNEQNEISGLAIFIKDITQKVLAEENTRKTEKLFREVINSNPDSITFIDTDFKFQAVNNAAAKFIKKIRNVDIEIGQTRVQDVVRESLLDDYLDGYKRAFEGEILKKEVTRPTSNPDQPFIYTDEFYYPVRDENNNIIGAANSAKDVTDTKTAELKSKEFQRKFLSILNSSTDFIILINSDLTIGATNTRYLDRVKKYYNKEVVFDKTVAIDLLPAEHREMYQSIFEKVLKGENHIEIFKRTYSHTPEIFYSEEYFFPILSDEGVATGISVFARDITEKVNNQEKIRLQDERFKSVINSTTLDGILVVNRDWVITGFNKSYKDGLYKNYGIEVVADKYSIFDLLPPQFHEEYKQIFINVFNGKVEFKNNAHPTGSGTFTYTVESLYPIFDTDKNVVEASVFIRDITENYLSQQTIRENETKFKLIADTTNDASYDFDVRNDKLYWFGGFERIFGFKAADEGLSFKNWEDSVHPDDLIKTKNSYLQALQNPETDKWRCEYRIISANGETKHVFEQSAFIRDEDGNAIRSLGGIQDITLVKNQEELILKALKDEQSLNEELATREEELTASEEQLKNLVNELTNLNSRLLDKDAQMKSIINSTTDYILLLDTNLNIQFFNNAYRDRIKQAYNKEVKEGENIFNYMREEEKGIYEAISHKIFSGEVVKTDTHIKETDIYREEYYNPVFDSNGQIWGYSVFLRDVTEKVKARKELESSEQMLRETQDLAMLGSWKFDLKTQKFIWTDCLYSIYGISPETEITLELFRSLYVDEKNKLDFETIRTAIQNKVSYRLESYYVTPDGVEKYLFGIGNPVFDETGELIEYIGSIQDITDRRKIELSLVDSLAESQKLNETLAQREEELTSNEEELRTYVEELSLVNKKLEENESLLNKNLQLLNLTGLINKVGGWEYDVATDRYYLTDQMYLMRGLKVGDDLTFNNTLNFYSPEDGAILKNKLDQLIQKGDPYDHEMQMTTVSGDKIWVRSIGYAEIKKKKVVKAYGAVQDITKRKLDQQKLIDSETNLKAIINNTDFGIWAIDKEFRLIAFNDVFSINYLRYEKIEPRVGMKFFKTTGYRDDSQFWKSQYEKAIQGEKLNFELEIFDGTYEFFISPITRADGNVSGLAVISNNISHRKMTEKQIKSNEEKFRVLFEKSKVSMMLFDRENVIDCNHQTLELFQLNNKEELEDLLMPMFEESGFEGYSLVNNPKYAKKLSEYPREQVFEWTHTLKDGNQLYGEISTTPIEIDGKEVLFSQFYNLTERKMAETKILESENFLNSIINNIPIGLLIINELGEVERMNSALMSLTGIPENWQSRGGINFANDPFLAEIGAADIFKNTLKGGVVINEELKIDFGLSENEWNMRDDETWFLVTAFPIYENKAIKNVVVALIDITVDKKNEEKIRENAEQLIAFNKQMAEYKLMALRSVMNPHFLFNSLNSIQYFIAKNDREQALNYLSLFSKLIRSILNSSIDNSHSLSEEISILRFYTDLETLRFDNKFKTVFEIDEDLDIDTIEIPSLILQPYVENAILHGLYNKESDLGVLSITFKLTEDNNLLAVIQDNGVGRLEALEIKQASKIHRSVGMLVTQERLELINKDNNLKVNIIDLKDKNGKPAGTRVEVLFNI